MKKRKGCLEMIFGPLVMKAGQIWGLSDHETKDDPHYRLRDDFLSRAEFSFYQVLRSMMKDFLVVCPKVSVAEIIYVQNQRENFGAFGRIRQKRIDFLICEPSTMRPKFAIELDDSSHNHANRIERDLLLDKVFEQAGLPLLHIPSRREYNTRELGELFRKVLVTGSSEQKTALPTRCPKCDGETIIRTAKSGPHAGKKFLGCKNFPKCQFFMPITE